jgi:hypothetical protein
MKGTKEAEILQVNLRLRQDMRRRIMRAAKKAKRSFNAEIVARLERSFDREHADDLLERAKANRLNMIELYNVIAERFSLPEAPALFGGAPGGTGRGLLDIEHLGTIEGDADIPRRRAKK